MKLARQNGVEELLPFSVKSTEERLRKRAENGLRVKGTGVGQRVKGKESERTLKGRYVEDISGCFEHSDLRSLFLEVRAYADGVLIQVGEAQTGYVGDAADDTDVEGGKFFCEGDYYLQVLIINAERSWSWMEEVAEINASSMMTGRSMMFGRRSEAVRKSHSMCDAWKRSYKFVLYQNCTSPQQRLLYSTSSYSLLRAFELFFALLSMSPVAFMLHQSSAFGFSLRFCFEC